jgi:hypothetical protein
MKSFHEWLKETTATPEAPPAPVRTPKAPPKINPTTPKPKRFPFSPKPNPDNEPAGLPKGKDGALGLAAESVKKKIIFEAWEDVDPSVKNFIQKYPFNHPFGKHDILAMPSRGGDQTYGERIARDSHESSDKFLQKQNVNPDHHEIEEKAFRAYKTIQQVEMNHKEDLEWKAVDLVSNLLHIPSDLLHAHLSRKKEKGRPEGEDYKGITGKQPPKMLPVDSDLRQHVNRRITMNMLNQGHALNAMDSLHKSIESELVQIDPRLPALYSELSGTSKSRFLYSNFIEMLKNPNTRIQALASEAEVFFDQEDQRFEVSATAPCFIFLIQELLKGAFELINEHSFENMPLEKRQTIAHTADAHEDEAWHFLYGPELWRLFARMVPRRYKFGNKLMELLMQLNATDPNRVNKILRTMVEEYYDIKDKGHDFEKHEDLDTEFSRELDKLMQELEQE